MSDIALDQFVARRAAREHQARTFELEGERLTVKPSVAPEIPLRLAGLRARVTAHTAAAVEADEQGTPIPPAVYTDQELLDVAEETIRSCLEPSSIPAWNRLRDPERPNPLTLQDLYWLCDHVLARASGLPTERPVDSSTGPDETPTSSKDASPSEAVAATT